MGAGVCI